MGQKARYLTGLQHVCSLLHLYSTSFTFCATWVTQWEVQLLRSGPLEHHVPATVQRKEATPAAAKNENKRWRETKTLFKYTFSCWSFLRIDCLVQETNCTAGWAISKQPLCRLQTVEGILKQPSSCVDWTNNQTTVFCSVWVLLFTSP